MAESSTTTPKKRGPGRPFQPGQSGNPGGRPKGIAERVQKVVGRGRSQLIQALWLIAQGTSEQRRAFFGDSVKVTAKDRMDAIQTLLDRGFGKASQTVALTGAEGGPLVVRWMSASEGARWPA